MSRTTATRTRTALVALARREGWTVHEDLWGNASHARGNPSVFTDQFSRGGENIYLRFLGEKLAAFHVYNGTGAVLIPKRNKLDELVGLLIA